MRCTGCSTSPSGRTTAACATSVPLAIWLSYAGWRSILSGAMAQPRPVCGPGGKGPPGTTTTCSSSWRGRSSARRSRETPSCWPRSLVDPLPAPAIASGPEGAQGAGRSLVVDPVLMRAADDPVDHRDRAHAEPLHVGQDLLRHAGVLAHIARLGEPSLEFDGLFVLGPNDADGQLARPAVIRPVEGDRGHRVASKAFLGLPGQPLAGLLPDHAFPVQLSGPATQSHKLALRQRPQGPSRTKPQAQPFMRCPCWSRSLPRDDAG